MTGFSNEDKTVSLRFQNLVAIANRVAAEFSGSLVESNNWENLMGVDDVQRADDRTAEKLQRMSQLINKIKELTNGRPEDEVLDALATIYVDLWANICCTKHRKEAADCLTNDIPKMLEEAERRAAQRTKKLH
jgi:hypothetical protein